MAWTRPGPGRPPKHAPVARIQDLINREEAKAFAARIVDDPQYQQNLLKRALAGDLHPSIEAIILFYRFGRPADTGAQSETPAAPEVQVELSRLSDDQLVKRAEQLAEAIRKVKHVDTSEPLEGEVVRSESLVLIKR